MHPQELVRRRLPTQQPITDGYEARNGMGSTSSRTWYSSQQEHLIGWLPQYNGPGAYDRKGHGGDARAFYQRFQCAPGLLWLAEALGEEEETLEAAVVAIEQAPSRAASQCGAFRKVIPWTRIEQLLAPHV